MTRTDPDPFQTGPSHDPAPHRPHEDDTEQVYFEGSPLLRGELGRLLLFAVIAVVLIASPFIWKYYVDDEGDWPVWWVTLALIVLGLIVLLIPYLIIKSIRYKVTNYRVDWERGILGKTADTLELWHVDDIRFSQSFFGRLLGVGTITILSNDKSTPKLDLIGMPNARSLYDTLKQRVISIKRQRGVIKMDTGG